MIGNLHGKEAERNLLQKEIECWKICSAFKLDCWKDSPRIFVIVTRKKDIATGI